MRYQKVQGYLGFVKKYTQNAVKLKISKSKFKNQKLEIKKQQNL